MVIAYEGSGKRRHMDTSVIISIKEIETKKVTGKKEAFKVAKAFSTPKGKKEKSEKKVTQFALF